MPNLRIFFTGATGYIGGSILTRILKHPKRDTFDITILIRDASKTAAFESFGLKVATGSLDDVKVIEKLAYESDFVFQCADADHQPATGAILKGMKKRYEETGVPRTYIHTSGTGALIDDAQGLYEGGIVYSDLDIPTIEAIPITAPHRAVDTTLVKADQEGYVKTYIVYPSIIWGIADNAFTEKNLQRQISIIVPWLVENGLKRGTPTICGKGLNVWPHINIEEMGDFYYVLFDSLLAGKELAHGREGYYVLENGEFPLGLICKEIGKHLYEAGKVDSPEPVDLTQEERAAFSWAGVLGANSRAKGDRARQLNWKPVKTTDDFIASVKADVEFVLKNNAA